MIDEDEDDEVMDMIEDDDEDEEEDDGLQFMNVMQNLQNQRRGGAAAALDIINMNARGGADPHHQQRHFRGYGLADHHLGRRQQQAQQVGGVDWSQEEAEVQRILANLRGNQPEEVRPIRHDENEFGDLFAPPIFHQPHYGAGQGDRNRDRQRQGEENKKSLIQQTFEELKIVSDQELYDMIISQQTIFEKDVNLNESKPSGNPFERLGNDQIRDELNALGGQQPGLGGPQRN